MGTHRLPSARSVRGMTLLEVLAAVFCLGMGLIMVAGAFPAGAHQTRMTIERTDASQMAKCAMEYYITMERAHRKLTLAQWKSTSPAYDYPMTVALGFEDWCVWNPTRFAYLENFNNSKMSPPGSGDYVMRGFLTRVSAVDEAPLFRLTVVVARYNGDAPDLYDRTNTADADGRVGVRTLKVTGFPAPVGMKLTTSNLPASATTLPTSVAADHFLSAGDYVMDTSTGFCYPVTEVLRPTVTLGEQIVPLLTPSPSLSRDWFMFRNVIGVFYRLVS